ncbi:hypothetical protein C8A01DRAFT_39053 [Parachaetomium inaequale]|uniref:Uncharacterized protein n=1 Tax=Parachaetomium inaequale TaxID=2588326 RepID=A0AAN6PBP2_9PEZI|nr:hypothetical protein C8A01DRAFT_39053 [Parachaetomium inaequale]
MSDQVTDKRRRRRTKKKKSRARSPQDTAIQQPTPNPQDEARAESAAPEDDLDAGWFARTANGGFRGRGTTDLIRRQLDLIDALGRGAMLDFAVHPASIDPILAEEHLNHQDQREEARITSLASAVGHLSLRDRGKDMDMDMDVSPMASTGEATVDTPAASERPVTAADNHDEESDSDSEYTFVPKCVKKRGVGRRSRPTPANRQERRKQRAKAREAQKLARAQRAVRWSRRAHDWVEDCM